MAAQFGAHEMMEMHEILTNTINGLNELQLFRPHTQDPQLRQMIENHMQFMINEYNGMVQALNQRGMAQAVPYRAPKNFNPTYGLDNPATQTPNVNMSQFDDRDVSSAILGCCKSATMFKTMAALECADPGLRRMLQQGAMNCSEMAYEIWQYMNQKGYYQVPTMKDMTTNTMIQSYGQAPAMSMQNMQNMPNMNTTMNPNMMNNRTYM